MSPELPILGAFKETIEAWLKVLSDPVVWDVDILDLKKDKYMELKEGFLCSISWRVIQ